MPGYTPPSCSMMPMRGASSACWATGSSPSTRTEPPSGLRYPAIVSTVVPQLGPEYRSLSERHLGGGFLKVGPDLKTGMPILIDNPHELGADRLVNAVAAYAEVQGACVTVDFGTSTNFDVVSGAGEYLGGVIGRWRR